MIRGVELHFDNNSGQGGGIPRRTVMDDALEILKGLGGDDKGRRQTAIEKHNNNSATVIVVKGGKRQEVKVNRSDE